MSLARRAYLGALALGVLAVGLPLFTRTQAWPAQVALAAVVLAFVAAGWAQDTAFPVAIGAAGVAALGAVGDGAVELVVLPLAAVAAVGAIEALSLARLWRGLETAWAAERAHARAGAQRVALGGGAASAVAGLVVVELPSVAVAAAGGVVATGALVWAAAARAG